MRRLAAALCFATVSANSALASPAMTTVPTQMRQAPSSHAPIVQSIPPNAEIDVGGCGKIWCSASWRDIPGYVRASSIAAAPGAPPLVYADAPPPPPPGVVMAPPLVVAPYGCCWGPGWGWGHPWHHYYGY